MIAVRLLSVTFLHSDLCLYDKIIMLYDNYLLII